MAQVVLNVQERDVVNKREKKALRRGGRVPATYYIHGENAVALSVDEKELKGAIHSDANIIDLSVGGKKNMKCVIRDIQWHPVAGNLMHVDFMGIKMTEKVTVTIPIHLVGTSIGVKNGGGISQQILREISIECLPADIPEHLEVDITNLDVGGSFLVGDLALEKVKVLTDADQSIVIVRPPTVVQDVVAVEGEASKEPERIGERKEADEGGV